MKLNGPHRVLVAEQGLARRHLVKDEAKSPEVHLEDRLKRRRRRLRVQGRVDRVRSKPGLGMRLCPCLGLGQSALDPLHDLRGRVRRRVPQARHVHVHAVAGLGPGGVVLPVVHPRPRPQPAAVPAVPAGARPIKLFS